jgi:hypothetical protein
VDRREHPVVTMGRVIAELTGQLGRAPTFAEGLLIRRAARASLLLDLFDQKILAGGNWTQVDAMPLPAPAPAATPRRAWWRRSAG